MLGAYWYLFPTTLKRECPGEEGETVSARHWQHGLSFCPLQGSSEKDRKCVSYHMHTWTWKKMFCLIDMNPFMQIA